jgi:hypothetical protein
MQHIRNTPCRPARSLRAAAGLALAAVVLLPVSALADACTRRPSELIRSGTETAVAGARGAAADLAARAEGAFTFTNAMTGMTMLASNPGSTGALGQIGSTAGAIGGAAAGVLAAPATVVAGAVAAVGLGAYESWCFFRDERITDYDEVLALMHAVAASADPSHFRLEGGEGRRDAQVVIADGAGGERRLDVRRLYVVNGDLMHRDWGPNTALGRIGHVTPAGGGG